jgi:protein gp37
MATVKWPKNAWVGTTISEQKDVEPAEEAFSQIDATVKQATVCPMMEPITFNRPELFQWFHIGGLTGAFSFIPPPEWVDSVIRQARSVGAAVYMEFTAILPTGDPDIYIREMPVI